MYFTAFLYGFLAAVSALLLEVLFFGIMPLSFYPFPLATEEAVLPYAFIGLGLFALLEEGARFLFLTRFGRNSIEMPSRLTITLLLGFVFGLGFSLVEVLFHFFSPLEGGLNPNILFLHVVLSIFLGTVILKESSTLRKRILFLFLAFTIHLAYNLVIFWN